MRNATVYSVLIASPGDVQEEREAICSAIANWNSANSASYGVYLQPTRWELDATPEMGDRPQAIINDQIVQDADILIGIFWTRLGTPTGVAESGTAEEIDVFQKNGKPIRLYFSDKPCTPSDVDTDQLEALRQYKEKCSANGLIASFNTIQELTEQLQRHLTKTVTALGRSGSNKSIKENPDDVLLITPNRASSAYAKFMAQFYKDIQNTKPDFDSYDHTDEAIMQQIDVGVSISDQMIRAADIATEYDSLDAVRAIYNGFGQLLDLQHPSDEFTGHYKDSWFDGYKFLIYRSFVGFIAVLVKAEKWDWMGKILSMNLFDPSMRYGGYVTNDIISCIIPSLDNDRNKRLGLNHISVTADVLKEQFETATDLPITFSDFVAADYFLFLRSACLAESLEGWYGIWAPICCVYLSAPIFLRKCESRDYLGEFCTAIGIDMSELLSKIGQINELLSHAYPGIWRMRPWYDFSKLGTI
ncbi:DUF4062 domain-containing protein [bacterium]|nr:DUF4062 domain-containing protein [bacterium]